MSGKGFNKSLYLLPSRVNVEERLELLESGIDELVASMSTSSTLTERLSAYRQPND